MVRYREIVASIESPLERKDEVIRSVGRLLQDAARVDLITEGAITQDELEMDVRHDELSDRYASDEGSHLLPRF